MIKMSDSELKQTLLGILIHFDSFCREHNLRYSLSEGTLLGAARHKGFIPWDDDIDLVMPREDYNKFLKLYKDGRYKIIKAQDDSPFWFFCLRLTDTETSLEFDKDRSEGRAWFYKWGAWIDINPLDNCPDDETSFRSFQRKVGACWALYRVKCRNQWMHSSSLLRNLAWLMMKILLLPVPKSIIRNLAYRTIDLYNSVPTSRKCWWDPTVRHLWAFSADYFKDYTQLEFEKRSFPVVKEWNRFLTEEYGDYMQLPPEEERIAVHGYEAYYK